MARKKPRKKPDRKPGNSYPTITISCPRCGKYVKMKNAGDQNCYSGQCGPCKIEIEAVAVVGEKPTTEVYPMPGSKPLPKMPDDYHLYFPIDPPKTKENDNGPERKSP